jgi:hypothetical protein
MNQITEKIRKTSICKGVYDNFSTKNLSTFLLIFSLLFVFFLPKEILFQNSPKFCLHHLLLHFDCPGCGMTRALHSFLHGEFQLAVFYNYAIVPFIILIIQYLISSKLPKHMENILKRAAVYLFTSTIMIKYFISLIDYFNR